MNRHLFAAALLAAATALGCSESSPEQTLVAPEMTQTAPPNEMAEWAHHHNAILVTALKQLKLHKTFHRTLSAAKADTIARAAMNGYLLSHSFDTMSWAEWNNIRAWLESSAVPTSPSGYGDLVNDPFWEIDTLGVPAEALRDSIVFAADLSSHSSIIQEIERLEIEADSIYDPEGLEKARLRVIAALMDSSLVYWDNDVDEWVGLCNAASDLCAYSGPYTISYAAAVPPLAAADAVGCIIGAWNSRHYGKAEIGASCLITGAGVSLLGRLNRFRRFIGG